MLWLRRSVFLAYEQLEFRSLSPHDLLPLSYLHGSKNPTCKLKMGLLGRYCIFDPIFRHAQDFCLRFDVGDEREHQRIMKRLCRTTEDEDTRELRCKTMVVQED